MLSRFLPDRFILWLLTTVALSLLVPVSGSAAIIVDTFTLASIFALFFLHGVRLPRQALLSGVTDWRLHLAILILTFTLFPLLGLALARGLPGLLAPELWTGILFLCALPSTVQSSIAYTSIARGNVAGAVAAAAYSNLVGVFLTPLLAWAMLQAQSAAISWSGIARIFALLFLPFVLGHALRPWLRTFVETRPRLTTAIDKGTILLAVYGAFSAATQAGVWGRLSASDLAVLVAILLLILAAIIGAALLLGRLGHFPAPSRAAILFCGSVKSLVAGAPMARLLFAPAAAGIVILPVMLFHTLQLIVCAWIAGALARRGAADGPAACPGRRRDPGGG